LFKRAYADDLVVIIQEFYLEKFLDCARETFEEFNLVFNRKKSKIMEITSSFGVHQVKHQRAPQIKELDVISEYNYLGAILDNKASMRSHLKTLKKKCFYLERKALFYAHKLSLKNQYLLWMIYIRTHFGYCSGFLDT